MTSQEHDDRRSPRERRQVELPIDFAERRSGLDRRSARERRCGRDRRSPKGFRVVAGLDRRRPRGSGVEASGATRIS